MGLKDKLMKVIVKVRDVVSLVRRFEESPAEAMREVVSQVREAAGRTLEEVMDAEFALFLGQEGEAKNKKNGYRTRTFTVKGLGTLQLRVPRDRAGRFQSKVVPARRRYDAETEKDLAMLNLAGLSTRMLAQLGHRLLGVRVSPQEVSNSLHAMVPAAKAYLERPLGDRRFMYLYIDGTNFRVRRTTVDIEPTLVVVGVDETERKSVLAMISGGKDNRAAWEMVFTELQQRGLQADAVRLGIMDGLPGLEAAFREAFPGAKTGRCWVHKARNVLSRVPRRYQSGFQDAWNAVQYADSQASARAAFEALKARWGATCGDAVACMERDLESLLVHYEFPAEHWEALRTTNPIERVNKEFKRRSKAMEVVSPDGLKALLAFTALRLEFGWQTTPLSSNKLKRLRYREHREAQLAAAAESLLN